MFKYTTLLLIVILIRLSGPAGPAGPTSPSCRPSPFKSRFEKAAPEYFRKLFLHWMYKDEIAVRMTNNSAEI
jgi:hypothetical protein